MSRDDGLIEIVGQIRDGLAELKANVIAKWGRIPHVSADPTSPPDGSVWLRSDDRRLRYRANGVTIGGDVGFRVWRSTNEAVLATGNTRDVTFDTIVQSKGGWIASAGSALSASSFTVPAGGDGVYALQGAAYWATPVINVTCGVSVNGVGVFSQSTVGYTGDRLIFSGAHFLSAGDVVKLSVGNFSGGNITITSYPGDASTTAYPILSVWRVAT